MINEMPNSQPNPKDPFRAYAAALVKAIDGVKVAVEHIQRDPVGDVAVALTVLNTAIDKLIKKSEQEIKDGDPGKDGKSISKSAVDKQGHLILTFSDNSTLDAGKVRGEDGLDGEDANQQAIVDQILASLKVPTVDEEGIIKKVLAQLPKNKQVTSEEILRKIKDGKLLSFNDLADLPDIVELIRKYTAHLEGNANFAQNPLVGTTSALSKLFDVDLTGLQVGNTITWNGTKWTPGTGGGAITLTTTGTSGAATLIGSVLNIPQYTGSSGIAIGTTPITSGTDKRVLFQDGSAVGEDAGFTYDKTAKAVTLLGAPAANTSGDALILSDTTAATVGNQQYSGRLRLNAQGWKTAATAGSQSTDFYIENQPLQGTNNPLPNLVFASQANGAAYAVLMSLQQSTTNNVGSLTVGSSGYVTHLFPGNDGSHTIGNAGARWGDIFSFGNLTLSGTASQVSWSGNTFLTRKGAANVQLGAADAASPVAQLFSVQSVLAGTSNTAGVDWTDVASLSTGTAISGNKIISTGFANIVGTATVTITIATPGVITWTAHGLVTGSPVVFTTSGALPTGIVAGTTYYAITSTTLGVNTFQIATTPANAQAGTAIATTGSQSGTQTGTTSAIVVNPAQTVATFGPSALTGSQTTPAFNLTQTWNTSGIATAFKINVINVTSSGAAMIADFQRDSVSRASIRSDGLISGSGYSIANVFAASNAAGVTGVNLAATLSYGWVASGSPFAAGDTFLSRGGVATVQLGAPNAASPIAQTLQAQGSRAGTDTNVAAPNFTIQPGAGTGNATPPSLLLRAPIAVASGTGAQTFVTAMTITGLSITANLTLNATSPVFVTPNLGTPTTLVLTNATGLPIGGISATGTPSSTTFLRGDGAWATPAGAGGGITRSINVISSPTTAGATAVTDYVYLVSGTTTLTLPTAVGNTNCYTVKNTGTNTVTIATTSAQTIDGSTTASLPVQYTSLDLVSDGANWNIV